MEDLWSNIAQDIQSVLLLLLPVDIEGCGYIYQTGSELYRQMSLSTSHIITVFVFLTHGLNYRYMHVHVFISVAFGVMLTYRSFPGYTTILSLYPQGLNEQGVTPGLSPNHAFSNFH